MEKIIASEISSADGTATVEVVEIVETAELPAEQAAPSRLVLSFDPKRVLLAVTILAGLAALYFGKGLLVAAVVNNKPIGRVEVIKALEKQSGKAALTSLVNNRLIDDAAAAKGIVISNDEVQAEIKKVEGTLSAQGMTLEAALQGENMTRADLEKQVVTRKKVERLLGDKIAVPESDYNAYVKENKITFEKGKEAEQQAQIKEQLVNAKLSVEAPKLLEQLAADAHIKYFVNF